METSFRPTCDGPLPRSPSWSGSSAGLGPGFFSPRAGQPGDCQAQWPVRERFPDRAGVDASELDCRQRLATLPTDGVATCMARHHPRCVLRNHLGGQAIRQANENDFSEIDQLLRILPAPHDEHPQHAARAGFPPDRAPGISASCAS